ncbi:hypothetical protein DesfrDRAFT_0189 [Solidesulfovibrio fructosivorans JJ]]|uniref:Uncharacterized protein n=1 Tax=Solidesulfovibrio fructosivorans JJ] TaxID=596151 RepID=E1JRE0_SOLFR|nr:hypothetical protein DesfrDRAFT_0189 [Solidesulfovibrio fructosivorans JJ]]
MQPRELTQEERDWIDDWLPRLPMRVAREAVYEVTAGLIKPATLSNADAAGTGPAKRYSFGRKKVVYDMRDVLEWFVRKHGLNLQRDLAGMVACKEPRRRRPARKGEDARTAVPSPESYAA